MKTERLFDELLKKNVNKKLFNPIKNWEKKLTLYIKDIILSK